MPWTDWGEDDSLLRIENFTPIGLDSFLLKQKDDKITRNFFPAVYIGFATRVILFV